MNQNYIIVSDASNEMGIRKQSLFKIIKKLGIKTVKQKSSDHRGQTISFITQEDFEFIKENYSVDKNSKDNNRKVSTQSDHGFFYLIQLEPEFDPGRFKLGFTISIEDRLRKHKCSAPYAKVISYWPCHLLWEKTAIDSITQNCEKVHTEVFRCKDLKAIEEKCQKFFELMPPLQEIKR